MKRVYCIVILAFITSHIALSQNWVWGKGERNGNSKSTAHITDVIVDVSGNIYEAGSYWGINIYGSDTLPNEGQNGNACLIKYDVNGNVLWTRYNKLPNTKTDWSGINSICADKSGSVYIGGEINGSAVFGSDTITDKGFLVKYDSSGRLLWAQPFSDEITWIASDAESNIYLVFENTADIQKYDSSGHMIWNRSISASGGYGEGLTVVTDNSGNVYFGGLFNTQLVLGKDTLISKGLYDDAFIAKYDTTGNEIWAKNFITDYACQCNSLATDNAGNVYMTGRFQDSLWIGSSILGNGTSEGNVFFAKCSSSGSIIWEESALLKGSTGYSLADGYSVCTDKEQNVYLSGTFEDTMTMGGKILVITDSTMYGNDPAFIYKFDSSGHALCATSVGRDQNDYCGVTADPLSNDIYFTGEAFYLVTSTFGSDKFNGGGEDYSFLAKWQPCNSPQGVNELPGSNNEIRIYPNPNSGVFTIKLSSSQSSSVEIYNMLGEGIYTRRINSESTQVDISSQPPGIYLYRITDLQGELIGTGKLIIQ